VQPESYFSNARPEMLAFVPSQRRRVLEIGCGGGAFAQQLVKDCEYWGVELSASAAERARRVGLDTVLVGEFQNVANDVPDGYFDVIICNDVIEHVVAHEAFLNVVRSKLAIGGTLVGSIPNVRYVVNLLEVLVRRDWRYRDEGILDRTHVRFFTETSLRRTLDACGYDILDLRGINTFSAPELAVWKRWAAMLVSRLLGSDTRFRQFGFAARPRHDTRANVQA